ncbi:DUF835 domain-containing protein [Palaeococcus ferrophilus]|uniref:DUF835 domain-containing protein n=1 Tax=Palaeococcus ferrophilus TaxID=83868 RepID=UPI000A079DD4|nr:DUF835 domain-containing protein [Palaeococcus ferrophilus]
MFRLLHRRGVQDDKKHVLVTTPEVAERIARLNRNVVWITRSPPNDESREKVHIWISKVEHPKAVHPSRLYVIEESLRRSLQPNSVIVFDAFEYIKVEQGTEAALRFVGKLRDLALMKSSKFVVSASDALDKRERVLLKRIVEE